MADYFLKIDGVAGESLDDRHRDEIEVIGFSWGESHAGTPSPGPGIGVGKVAMEPFNFTAVISVASPKLMLLAATGRSAKQAIFVARRPGPAQHEYLTVTMRDVTVAAYHVAGDHGEVPVEQVSLQFSKIQVDYRPQKPTGALGPAVHMGWDLKAAKEA
jgi:type VI secretion system secreted protein Hcp